MIHAITNGSTPSPGKSSPFFCQSVNKYLPDGKWTRIRQRSSAIPDAEIWKVVSKPCSFNMSQWKPVLVLNPELLTIGFLSSRCHFYKRWPDSRNLEQTIEIGSESFNLFSARLTPKTMKGKVKNHSTMLKTENLSLVYLENYNIWQIKVHPRCRPMAQQPHSDYWKPLNQWHESSVERLISAYWWLVD